MVTKKGNLFIKDKNGDKELDVDKFDFDNEMRIYITNDEGTTDMSLSIEDVRELYEYLKTQLWNK